MTDPVTTITHPTTGRTLSLGRNRPLARGPRMRVANYFLRTLPTPPAAEDYSNAADTLDSDILGNDANGDCTMAAAFHIDGTMIANAGAPIPATLNAAACLKLYYQLTGGPDTGLDEQLVWNYWQSNGLSPDGSHKIIGRAGVDGTDTIEVKTALWLFENIYICVSLPDAWISPPPSGPGFVWDVADDPNPDNGHAFCGYGYGPTGVFINSWGMHGTLTWAALAKYAIQANGGDLATVFSVDAINAATQKAPNGFDFSQLMADLQAFTI
jgi:hypothetical protein